jgi:exodeoxyribonuclease V gamma subunit
MLELKLHTSNRLENLAQSLADTIRQPLRSPFQPEIILVQSQGMARWLKLQLAQQHGICSNCQFPFPRAFSYAAFRALLPGLPEERAYEPELLVWRLMKQLPPLLDQPGFEGLKNYLAGEPDSRKLFQLADRVAYLFDQYLVFRPELVLQWEKTAADNWQSRLWREISSPFREQHPAALQARFIQQLEGAQGPIPGLPERLAIFGISALPPFYLRIFAALARHIEVNLFLLEPCEQFWGYISSGREQEKTLKRAAKGASEADQLHLEKGNRLLASMGQQGRDFLLLLQGAGDWQEPAASLFSDPGEASLLACIQSDILNLSDRGATETAKKVISDADHSVQVHSCHSPLRELEVLYDHLLDWFDKDPELAPRDILVMIPDIEQYAPFIQAVFGSPEQDALRIPFSVADRTARRQSHLIETFLSILNLAGTRLGASRVLALLETASLREKFELAEDDLELIRHWVEEVRIRWGEDRQQRAGLGLPAWPENTWWHGLERLLLGYAMAGHEATLFKGILPYDDIEGGAADVLGRLAEFIQRLFAALKSLQTPRRLDEWAETFQGILRDFFETNDDQASELQVLRACFEKLSRAREGADFDRRIDLAVVLEQVSRDLSEDRFGAGYLTGGVTFCALKPMRSIPAKVICLLGMNDRAFPRTSAQLSFDLMAQEPKLGDRSSREDDRYLFLETLVSARQRLYLSYVGQSIKDNSEAPPSVLVSELLDYIAQGFKLPGKEAMADHIWTRHRLQAFSTAYFRGGRLFSFSRENLQASRVILPERKTPGNFVPQPLAAPEPEWRRLTLQTLADFFCHPAKFLATKRLKIRLPSETAALEDREPFGIEWLDRYQLQEELLEQKLGGLSLTTACELVKASGRLPAGLAGDAHYAQVRRDVEVFFKRLQPFKPDRFRPPSSFELPIGDFVITANFNRATPDGLLFYRPAKIKPKDLLRSWVAHLLWQAANPDGTSAETVVLGTESFWRIAPVTKPLPVLEQLLKLYWSGLCEPLKFFPESSYAFAAADYRVRTGTQGKTVRQPIDFAQDKWYGNEFGVAGECEDEYFALFFRNSEELDGDFEAHARTVFDPLLEVSEETKE